MLYILRQHSKTNKERHTVLRCTYYLLQKSDLIRATIRRDAAQSLHRTHIRRDAAQSLHRCGTVATPMRHSRYTVHRFAAMRHSRYTDAAQSLHRCGTVATPDTKTAAQLLPMTNSLILIRATESLLHVTNSLILLRARATESLAKEAATAGGCDSSHAC
jgi:hypothetical protein